MKPDDNKIKRYLDNKISKEERLAFEQELKKDAALQEEVDFQREMFAFFKQRDGANDFKNVLQSSENDYFKQLNASEKKRKPIWLWFLIGIVVLATGYYVLFGNKTTTTTNETQDIETTQEVMSNDSSTSSPTPTSIQEDENEGDKSQLPEKITPNFDNIKNTEDTQEPDKVIDQPIAAAAFEPNPVFENILQKNVRANEVFTITAPIKNQEFALDGESILFKLSVEANTDSPISMAVYDNNPLSFDNDLKVLDQVLEFEEVTEDEYVLNFTANIPFKKGLYYMLLRNQETNEMISLQRFYVR